MIAALKAIPALLTAARARSRSKRMLDGFTPLAHLFRVLVEPSLDGLEDVFVFPAGNPAL